MFSPPFHQYQSKSVKTQSNWEQSFSYQTPRIVAFTYNSRNVSHSDYITKSKPIFTAKKQDSQESHKKIKLTSKLSSSRKSTKDAKNKKPIKINLMSSRKSNRSDYDLIRSSKVSARSQPVQMVNLPNHITVGNFVESLSCDIFSACNEASGVDYGQKINLDIQERNIEAIRRLDVNKASRKNQDHEDNLKINTSFQSEPQRNFKKKSIFETSLNLNTTNDLSPSRSRRSKSKKSIFKPREKSPLVSRDQSVEIKKRIFTQIVEELERSPNFGVKYEEKQLDETQIPKNIRQSWELFSESSHSWREQSFSKELGVVQEVKLEESVAKEVQ